MKVIYLLGMRSVGKTTLGVMAAKALKIDFLDIDEALEKKFQQSILSFVNEKGIEAFREEEFRFLEALEQRSFAKHTIVALGGGVVEKKEVRELLLRSVHPRVYLSQAPKSLWQRIEKYPDRRQIGALKTEVDFIRLYERREPYFQALATSTLMPSLDLSEAALELQNHCRKLL